MSFKKQMSSTFRRSLLIGIPVATVVGLTALAYAVPNIFSAGQGLSSSLMNQNFASLESEIAAQEAEIGGPGLYSSLQSQINALQAQVNALPAATISGGSVDSTQTDQYATSTYLYAAAFNIAPTVNCFMTVISTCHVGAAAVGGTPTYLEIDYSDNGGAYETQGWDGVVPYANGNDSGGATSISFAASYGHTYNFATQVINTAYTAATFECNLQAFCVP
jgi:hypothetical protein